MTQNIILSLEDARKVERQPVEVGKRYTFYSDCVECKTDHGYLIRSYSGQEVSVMATDAASTEGDIVFYQVKADNGDVFIANSGELNGWIFDTGQWVGPRVN